MSDWASQTCRACLLQDNSSAMYDLTVEDNLELYRECSNSRIPNHYCQDAVPQFLCMMCYKLCELLRGFRERCHQSEKKFIKEMIRIEDVPVVFYKQEQSHEEDIEEVEAEEELIEERIQDNQARETEIIWEDSVVDEEEVVQVGGEELDDPDLYYESMNDSVEESDPVPKKMFKIALLEEGRKPRITADELCPENTVFEEFKKGTKIWKYFTRCSKGRWAKCRFERKDGTACDQILAMGVKSSTGVLHRHLRQRHHTQVEDRDTDSRRPKGRKEGISMRICSLIQH